MSSDCSRLRSLLPSVGLLAATLALIWVTIAIDGFTYRPWVDAAFWAVNTLPFVAGALVVRWLLRGARTRQWRVSAVALREGAVSIVACIAVLSVLASIYSWGKLLIPYFRQRTFDAELYALDRWLHFGLDLNRLLLEATRSGWLDRATDTAYGYFSPFLITAVGWFLAMPATDDRHRFVRGFVLLWMGGLAIYWLIPALGPVFVFTDISSETAVRFTKNFGAQLSLMRNYLAVDETLHGGNVRLVPEFGVAAMPSLHVASPSFFYLFARERRLPSRALFLGVALIFLFGSVLVGWHYAVDGYVGFGLALAAWLAVRRDDPEKTASAAAAPSRS